MRNFWIQRITSHLDYDYRLIYLSSSSQDAPPIDEYVGNRPYDLVDNPREREYLRAQYRQVFTRGTHTFGNPYFIDDHPVYFYITVANWVGSPQVAIECVYTEYPWKVWTLTPREREVLYHLGKAFCLKKTARDMGIATSTASSIVQGIAGKLGLDGRTEVFALASNLAADKVSHETVVFPYTKTRTLSKHLSAVVPQ